MSRQAPKFDPFADPGESILATEGRDRRTAPTEFDPLYVGAAIARLRSMAGKIAALAKNGGACSEMQGDRSRAIELVDRIYDGDG